MKYIYTNVTQYFQACHLASKNQDSVSIRTFGPGGSITLDYPGLSMYVPSILSCMEIDVTFDEPVTPVAVIVEPPQTPLVELPPPAPPVPAIPAPKPTPKPTPKVAAKKSTIKKTKK
ncbi:MAG: hypothetical protein JHC33_07350 [Ignisphaera sp.]|nr:hypothetical protein [Ignisphaera sp.]